MIGAFLTQEIRPDLVEKYLGWRQRESDLSLHAPGFIKRQLVRDIERPNVFYYLVFWESQEHIDAFTQTPAFHAAATESGIREVMEHCTTTRVWVNEEFEVRRHN